MITIEQAKEILLVAVERGGGDIDEELDYFLEYINSEMGRPMHGQPKSIENANSLIEMWEKLPPNDCNKKI
jgi:hypothetical protein